MIIKTIVIILTIIIITKMNLIMIMIINEIHKHIASYRNRSI